MFHGTLLYITICDRTFNNVYYKHDISLDKLEHYGIRDTEFFFSLFIE